MIQLLLALPALAPLFQDDTTDPAAEYFAAAAAQEPSVQDGRMDPVAKYPRGVISRTLTLEEALTISLSSNLGLEIESLNTDVSRFNARGSWGAYDWVLNLTGRYTESERPQPAFIFASRGKEDTQRLEIDLSRPLTTGGTLAFGFDRTNERTTDPNSSLPTSTFDSLSVSLTQPLLRGAWSDVATTDQRNADVRLRQQREREREVRQQLLLDVTNAYWDLVDANEQYGVAVSFYELGLEQLRQNERRLEAGVGTEVEVIQAEADVATRYETRILQDVTVRDAMDALKILLFPGTEADLWDMELIPATPLPDPTTITPEGAPHWTDCLMTALENRSNLLQQRMEIEAAELSYASAVSDRMIGLDLELSAAAAAIDGDSTAAVQSALRYEFPTYSAALVLNAPLGNRAAKYAERSAWADVRRQKLTYDSLEVSITSEVRGAVRQVVYQAERVHATAESLRYAVRQLSAEEARYREGLSTNFQVLEFQQDLASAKSTEKRARVDYMKALAALESARGIIGEVPSR